jgi:hypothetical protein
MPGSAIGIVTRIVTLNLLFPSVAATSLRTAGTCESEAVVDATDFARNRREYAKASKRVV